MVTHAMGMSQATSCTHDTSKEASCIMSSGYATTCHLVLLSSTTSHYQNRQGGLEKIRTAVISQSSL